MRTGTFGFCLPMLMLLMMGAGTVAGAESYFESNASGMAVLPISSAEIGNYEYVLVVDSGANERIERLLKEGIEKRRVVTRSAETGIEENTYEGEELVSSVRYLKGLPIEERFYSGGELEERYEYSYTDGELDKVVEYDGGGTLVHAVTYARAGNGHIYRSEFTSAEASQLTLYRFGDEGLYEAWLGDKQFSASTGLSSGNLYRFAGSELVEVERWEKDSLVRRETVIETDSGSRREIEEIDTGKLIVRRYGTKGELLDETVTLGENRLEQTRYHYLDGLLLESTRLDSSGSEQHRYEYDDEGVLTRETVSANSVLQKVVVWTGENDRYEEIYRNGVAVLRVYFEDDRKIREELIK